MAQYPATSATFTSKLLVTKSNTAGEASLGTQSVTGAGAATASAWGQVSASLGADTLITQASIVSAAGFNGTDEIYIEVGYGAGGSETVVGAIPVVASSATTPKAAIGSARIPSRVASGQRLAARVTSSTSTLNGSNVTIRLWGIPYANVEGN